MTHPRTTWIDPNNSAADDGQLLPVYRLTDGINQRQIREIVAKTVETYAGLVEEAMPNELRQHASVCGIEDAIRKIHAPASIEEAEDARGRLVYQELLILQLALAIRRQRVKSGSVAPPLEMTPKIRARILRRFPFRLTPSQSTAVDEIAADMNRPFPMNRLLHGDVGSGKTAVALCDVVSRRSWIPGRADGSYGNPGRPTFSVTIRISRGQPRQSRVIDRRSKNV